MWFCIDNSVSKVTPRSWTVLVRWTTSRVTVRDDVPVQAASFSRLARDLNQMNSVFFGFICSRLDEHHRWISATHCCSRSTVDSALAVVVDAITWVSSAYKWWQNRLSIRSARSSVYPINFKGPNTDPCGALQSTGKGPDTVVHLYRMSVNDDKDMTGTNPAPCRRRQAPVHYLQQYLVVDGVKCRTEVQKDDSADVARVYRLDNLIVHGSNSGFCRMVRSVRRLSSRKKLMWLDMTPETVCMLLLAQQFSTEM